MGRETTCLDGRWQIAFDPGNVGKLRRWMAWSQFCADAPREFIDVPACWERFRQDYEGVAWYGHSFDVPEAWRDGSVQLHIGAANYLAEVYLNDQPVGYHEGGYTDFSFEVGDLLHYDATNNLVLRIIGPIITQDKVIDGIGRDDMPHWRGAIAGGLWQSVVLVACHTVHVSGIFADPDLQGGRVRAEVSLSNTLLRNQEIVAQVRAVPLGVAPHEDTRREPVVQESVNIVVPPGETTFETMLTIDHAEAWSLEKPFLYRLEVDLQADGVAIDTDDVRFGMRDFGMEDGHYVLNGDPILIKSTFFEGLYPTTLAAPPNEAFVRNELELAKEAGFNLIRPWRKPQPPMVYDLADEMGILFVGTMPIECMSRWPTMTPYAERRMRAEVRESVRRDRNHPCIIMWEIFNEIMRPSLQRIKPRVTREARKLDPTRLVLDESGGFGGGAYIYPQHSYVPHQINDVHNYPGAPLDRSGYDFLLSLAKTDEQLAGMGIARPVGHSRSAQIPGGFTHVSEIGYGSLPDLEANVAQYRREGNRLTPDYRYHHRLRDELARALVATSLDQVYPTVADYCRATQKIHAEANKLMVEAIRMNPDIAGFTIHAYTDGDWVVGAGLLDIFRNPKPAYWAARETNQPVYVALRTARRNSSGPEPVAWTANVASEHANALDTRLTVQVTGPDGTTVATSEHAVQVCRGVTQVAQGALPTEGLSGLYTLSAQLWGGDTQIAENAYTFRVMPREDIPIPSAELAVCDPSGKLQDALSARGIPFQPFGPGLSHAVLVLANASGLNEHGQGGDGLVDNCRAGGHVVYLDIPAGKPTGAHAGNQHLSTDWLPVQLCLRPTKGLWTPFMHVIREHPVSRGLPANKAMDGDYVNVYPVLSIIRMADGDPATQHVGLDLWSWLGEYAARAPLCTLGLGWQPGACTDDRDYRGPGPIVFGADLVNRACGRGRAFFSTLRLVDNLGDDPVADTLLANIIDWAASGLD